MRRSDKRSILKSLNGSIKELSNLSRDPPITVIANMERNGFFDSSEDRRMGNDLLSLSKKINNYRKLYWKLEQDIKQDFLTELKKMGYLPANSKEVISLKNALSDALIKGDDRIWVYSFDHYKESIAEKVGRPASGLPEGRILWKNMEEDHINDISQVVKKANELLPDLYRMKAMVQHSISNPYDPWEKIKMRKPKISKVSRPIKKVILIKRPIPLPKTRKKPKKKILKKPDFQVIGPEVKK